MRPIFPLSPLLSEGILGSPGEKFPYIVDHAVEQPLDVNLNPPPEGKLIHYLMNTDVGKYRFCDGHALMIDSSPFFAIDLCRHGLGQIACHTAHRNHQIFAFYLLSFDTLGPQLTPLAALPLATIPSIDDPIRDRGLHLEPEDFSMRTTIFIPFLLVLKVS